ncbi:DUF4097 family beta strand repeat-containing protein [Streptacidiphilus neutrinimicus]|uniref:DUF4097 family beta strand repeat-containing protein n=1 Tax=Streptacidiphilus neutrinimicus TaxID=105420 RepID=UPI0006938CF9|nr:DUF4097 family beta strand repeat-containing protein [Streptacidiphilus neutrinimicus]
MNRQKTVWWVLSAAVVVVVAAVSVSGLVAWLLREHHTGQTRYRAAEVKSVELDTGPGTVQVFPTTDSSASVTQNLSWVFSRPTVNEWLDRGSGTLHVDASCAYGMLLVGSSCDIRLDIAVPAATPIKAVDGSGQLTVTAMTGPVDAQAGSGEIDLEHVSGTVAARVGSGQISGSDLGSPQVVAKAGSGRIGLDFALPPATVTAAVSSGQASVSVPRGQQYRVTASAISGNTDVAAGLSSPTASATITVSVTSGEADVNYR